MNRPDESPKNSIIIYTTEDGLTKIDATFDGDTVWLSIDQMAELFQRDRSVIGKHVRNIFKEGSFRRNQCGQNLPTLPQMEKSTMWTITTSMSLSLSATGSNPNAAHNFASGRPAS